MEVHIGLLFFKSFPSVCRTSFYAKKTNSYLLIYSKAEWDAASQSEQLVVLDCYATWCGPCRLIAPKVEAFSQDYPDVKFYKLDVDEVADAAGDLGVRAMPTFFLFRKGEKIGEVVGANPAALKSAIEKNKN
ncbi:thioredoxin [Terfezia boudieri ATCC MYA-4762]|uniref:Thioredoxin n=1 Tax=Terfezia boudieri ATCC MYA-4762 TaxID=1051890 RepID=A0A3N4L9M7_9PEZI|nr:thioredoxin [Terfezia boudieri ATCC MYA-4762]